MLIGTTKTTIAYIGAKDGPKKSSVLQLTILEKAIGLQGTERI